MALLIALIIGCTHVAHAEPTRPLHFTYQRAPGAEVCPSEVLLRADISALVGTDPFDDAAAAGIECMVERTDDGFSADVQIVDADGSVVGHRRLHFPGHSCGELGKALGFTIAMVASRPENFLPQPREKAPAKPSPQPVVAARAPPKPAVQEAAQSRHRPVEGFAVAGFGAVVSSQPELDGRLRIGAGLRRGDQALELSVRLDTASTTDLPGTASVSVYSGAIEIGPCYLGQHVAACAHLGLGWVRGRGHNLAMDRAAITPQLGLGARLDWRTRPSRRLELRLYLGAEAALTRTTVLVDAHSVWKSPLAELGVGVAAVTHFR